MNLLQRVTSSGVDRKCRGVTAGLDLAGKADEVALPPLQQRGGKVTAGPAPDVECLELSGGLGLGNSSALLSLLV